MKIVLHSAEVTKLKNTSHPYTTMDFEIPWTPMPDWLIANNEDESIQKCQNHSGGDSKDDAKYVWSDEDYDSDDTSSVDSSSSAYKARASKYESRVRAATYDEWTTHKTIRDAYELAVEAVVSRAMRPKSRDKNETPREALDFGMNMINKAFSIKISKKYTRDELMELHYHY